MMSNISLPMAVFIAFIIKVSIHLNSNNTLFTLDILRFILGYEHINGRSDVIRLDQRWVNQHILFTGAVP